MTEAGKDQVSSGNGMAEPFQEPKLDDEALDAALGVAMMRVQDCGLEARAFGTKTSIILTANGVLLAIIASSFLSMEPWMAAMSIGAVILSVYRAISVLRIDMDVFKFDVLWEDTLRQNLDDGKFTKLLLTHKLAQTETKNQSKLANMTIKWDNAAILLLAAMVIMAFSLIV